MSKLTDNERKVCLGLLKLFKVEGKTADLIITEGQLLIGFKYLQARNMENPSLSRWLV